jgi:DNA-binding NarL/FixJ family response regulator
MNVETPKCVLLADRHYGVIEGIHGLLETTFATVVMVTDENSLMESASRMQPVEVVVDLSVTGGGGFSWLGRLLGQSPASKVIVLSVHDEPTVVQSALEAGASGFILKRAIATDLLTAVDTVLAGERYVSPAIPLGVLDLGCQSDSTRRERT